MSSVKGFTLAETVIVMGVATVVAALLIAILVNVSGVFFQQQSKVSEGVGANDALSRIRSSIKEAIVVASSYSSHTSGSSTLILKISSISSSGSILTDSFDYIVFTTESGKFKYKLFPSELSSRPLRDEILATGVEAVVFEYFDKTGTEVPPPLANKVKVTLKLGQNIATSEAHLRND